MNPCEDGVHPSYYRSWDWEMGASIAGVPSETGRWKTCPGVVSVPQCLAERNGNQIIKKNMGPSAQVEQVPITATFTSPLSYMRFQPSQVVVAKMMAAMSML